MQHGCIGLTVSQFDRRDSLMPTRKEILVPVDDSLKHRKRHGWWSETTGLTGQPKLALPSQPGDGFGLGRLVLVLVLFWDMVWYLFGGLTGASRRLSD